MPVAAPPPVDDRSALFPDDIWIYDRVTVSGIARDLLRPCECGSTLFVMILRTDGRSDHGAYCEACYRGKRHRLARKGDLIYGRLDAAEGILAYSKAGLAEALRVATSS